MSASVPLRYDGAAIGGGETTHVTNLSVTGVKAPCSVLLSSSDSIFVAELDLGINLDPAKTSGSGGISLGYGPGFPTTTVTLVCEDSEPVPLPLSWGFYYLGIFHADEAGLGGGLFTAKDWKLTGGKSPWATRSYGQVQVIPDGTISEITFLRIDHTPQ